MNYSLSHEDIDTLIPLLQLLTSKPRFGILKRARALDMMDTLLASTGEPGIVGGDVTRAMLEFFSLFSTIRKCWEHFVILNIPAFF